MEKEKKTFEVSEDTEGISFGNVISDLMQYAYLREAREQIRKTSEYVVEIPEHLKAAFEAGQYRLNRNEETGETWPALYRIGEDGRRKFVANLPVKKKEFIEGSALQQNILCYKNFLLQKQIYHLTELTERIYQVVKEIEKGQMDDRIGLLMAGKDQLALAQSREISAEEKKIAVALARNQIITAQKQILQTFKTKMSSFKAVPESVLVRLLRLSGMKDYEEKYDIIKDYYILYFRATQLLAMSYVMTGDSQSAELVFDLAEKEMRSIDFTALKTMQRIYPHSSANICNHAADYIAAEKKACLLPEQDYNCIAIRVSGEKLLEEIENEDK